MITAEEWKAYNDAVSKISDGAAASVENAVLGWCRSNPNATVAESREAAKLIMEGYMQSYDGLASAFAAKWYDHQAESNGINLQNAVTASVYVPKKTDLVARYQVRKLTREGPSAFARACGEYARNDALRALNETIIANVGRDKKKGVRFARVPTGRETCTFCIMLASRGAVYHTRKSAGEFKHFHRHCDCKVVPGFEDDPDAELVEGYKSKELYGLWKTFNQIDSWKWLSAADRNEIKARALTADASLFNNRKLGTVSYTKSRALLKEHEKAGIDYLTLNGFDLDVIKEDPKAPANLDISMDGKLWEMKNLTNSGSSVSNQVKRARVKWYKLGIRTPVMCVFTNDGNTNSFDEVCAALNAKRKAGEVFLVVAADGIIRTLKDK